MALIEVQEIVFCPKAMDDLAIHVCEDCEFHRGYQGSNIECAYGEDC